MLLGDSIARKIERSSNFFFQTSAATPHLLHLMLSQKARVFVLKAIIEEDENPGLSFKTICNRDRRFCGSEASDKRRQLQYKRQKYLKLVRENPSKFLSELRENNLPETMPKQVHLNAQEGAEESSDSPAQVKMSTRQSSTKNVGTKEAEGSKKATAAPDEMTGFGQAFHYSNGEPGFAQVVEAVRVGNESYLNPSIDHLLQTKEKIQNNDLGILGCEAFAIYVAAERYDIDCGLINLRRTTKPNVLALTRPFLDASWRIDLEKKDKNADRTKKLKLVARNFMQRNTKTGKMDSFWSQPAMEEHEKLIAQVAKDQAKAKHDFQVKQKTTLLVFPERFKFTSDHVPDNENKKGIIELDVDPFVNKGQGIVKARWLVFTTGYEVLRPVIDEDDDALISAKMAYGLRVSDEAEDEVEIEGI